MIDRLTRIVASRFAAPAVIILLGIAWRLLWLARVSPFWERGGESLKASISVAQTGLFADALGRGEGLTAHLNPIMPMIGGVVYWFLGIQTPIANWLLSLSALSFSIGSALLLYRSFGRMGSARGGRLLGLALYCLLPLSPFTELMEFRHWEGGLAVLLATGLLALIVETDAAEVLSWPRRFAIALLAAILFFINPPLGLAGYAMVGILLWRKLDRRSYPATAALAAGLLAAVLAPWAVRNYEAFGRFILVRGNAGLELALANHPAAVSGLDQQAVFKERLREIHPNGNPPVFARMKAMGGEIPYAAMLGRNTSAWIADHPVQFVRLSVRHLVQFYFPPSWLWRVYGHVGRGTLVKQMAMWVSAALGLAGTICAAFIWPHRFKYAAALAFVPALPYIVVQPILRYHYLVLGILLFLTSEIVARAAHRVRGSGEAATPDALAGVVPTPIGSSR